MLLILVGLLTEIADNTKTSDINEKQDDLGRGLFDVGQVELVSFQT
jgi:hypothetical protein